MSAAPNQVTITRRPPDIEDYIDMMRRYRSWIIGPMFAGLVIAVVIAFLWPDTYISVATMRITPRQVPEKLVPEVSNSRMAENLQQMRTVILSRQTLEEIIRKPSLELYKKQREKMPMEDITEAMRKDIQISEIMDISIGNRRGSSAFSIAFAYTDRYKAQAVVRELVSRFTEQNSLLQKNRATTTTNFLDDEKKQAKEKLDALDAQMVKFKMENRGRLPEQVQANGQHMSTIQMQIMNLNSQMSTLASDKTMIEAALKNQKAREKLELSRLQETVTVPGSTSSVKNENLINLDKTISKARSDLAALKKLFGNNHPEVINAEAVLTSLEEQRQRASDRSEAPVVTAPSSRTVINAEAQKALEELKSEVATTEAQIAAKQLKIDELARSIEHLNKELSTYQKKMDEAPLSEQQYYALQRELDMARMEYQDISKRRETAETQQSLEDHNAGETLEQLDPPSLPEKAAEPNRPVWAAAGLFGGLALAMVLAAAKEMKDTSLKNLKDVRAYTNLPVLSSIPLLENALLLRRKRRLVWLAWTSALVIGFILMGGSMYYRLTAA